MKKLLILFLLTLSVSANAQINKKLIHFMLANSGTSSDPYYYADLPDEPNYGANPVANLTTSVGASVSQTALNTASGSSGTKHATIVSPFLNRLQTLQLVGTNTAKYYWKPTTGRTLIGGGTSITSGQKIVNQTGGTISDYHVFYGFDVRGADNPATSGIIGMAWTARVTTGTRVEFINNSISNVSSAGVQINDGVTANFYDSLTFKFNRIIGDPGVHEGTEGEYLGSTNPTTYSLINNSILEDGFIAYRGWDGAQRNSHANMQMDHYTVFDVGNLNAVGQRNLLQAQNVKGTISNCIFWNAPDMFVIAATGLNLVNCYFYSTGAAGLWQDLDLDAGYGASSLRDHTPNTVTNCHFYTDAAVGYAIDFREGNTNTTFTNCTTNKAALYLDNRVDKVTYTLSQTGTTTGAAIPSAPTFNSVDPDNAEAGLVQEIYWRLTGAGYRNRLN